MKPWQSYARVGVALAGAACAAVVYSTLGSRRVPPAPAPIERIDPTAALETTGGEFQRVRDGELEFDVTAKQSLFYENGSVRQRDVSITARNRGGRDFVVTAKEARSEEHEQALQLDGNVALTASDGFALTTDHGSFDRATGIAASPGEVAFHKGGMRGSGVGMTYEQSNDVLRVLDRAMVETTSADGTISLSFSAAQATLDRVQHVLLLDGDVRVIRGGQVIGSDHAVAALTEDLDVVTRIELRGRARVEGGATSVARMEATDIDLDYGADGSALEHVALMGQARIVTGGAESPENRIAGERLNLRLSGDGGIEQIEGDGGVTLDQPGPAPGSRRRVAAERLTMQGQPGRGVAQANFAGNVRYEEGGDDGRRVTASSLRLGLLDSAVREAEFSGRVAFADAPLAARADRMVYRPVPGALALAGADARGRPRLEDERITVESDALDVTLTPLTIAARGTVKTTLRPSRGGPGEKGRMPGLLKQGEAVNVNADALSYDSALNRASYTGSAALWQGDTAIRADAVMLDQANGNLTASGTARSTLLLGAERSSGRAHQIVYTDAERRLAYLPPPPAPVPPGAARPARPTGPQGGGVALNGPEGDLRAERIEVLLGAAGGAAERLEAFGFVSSTMGARTLTGDRLTYLAAEERYEVSGRLGAPVRLLEACRETVGRTLIFFKSTDRIIVDGDGRGRSRTEGRGACPPATTGR